MRKEIKTRIEMISRGEVPEGYKRTKVGIIPEDWEVKRLGEIAEIGSSKRIMAHEYVPEGIPFYRSKEIIEKSLGNKIEERLYISRERYQEIASQFPIPQEGEILITAVGTLGIPYLIRRRDLPFYFKDGNLIWFREIQDVNKEYLIYLWLSEAIIRQIENTFSGSSQKALTIEKVNKLKFPNAPLPEQKKIAQILSTWDQAIELKEKLIEEKKEQKKGLMQKLLTGEVRLPGFDGEWEEVRLGQLGKCIRGVSYKPDDLLDKKGEESITLLRANNIIDFRINHKEVQYVKKNNVKKEQLIQDKDIAIAMSSGSLKSVGKTGFCNATEMGMCVGAFCAIYRTNNIEFAEYIKHFFETDLYSKQLIGMLEGTNINNLKNSDIELLKIKIPKEASEVKKVSNLLSTSDKEIDLLTQELEQLKLQKKGLMQLLLTGIIRVKS